MTEGLLGFNEIPVRGVCVSGRCFYHTGMERCFWGREFIFTLKNVKTEIIRVVPIDQAETFYKDAQCIKHKRWLFYSWRLYCAQVDLLSVASYICFL